jgi:hypothetical protein
MTSSLLKIFYGQRALSICALFLATLLTSTWSRAEGRDELLLDYAVNIQMSSWTGHGIYIGRGFFITAAHVVGQAWRSKPAILIKDHRYPTRVVKEGSFETTDLTLLSVAEELLPLRLTMRRTPLCKEPSWPGQRVLTVVPGATTSAHVISAQRLPIAARKYGTVIGNVAKTGNSGSGVFDAQKRCLLGIISRKISQSVVGADGKTETRDIAKYFVPTAEIAAFLPDHLRL